jgi:putative transposase
MRFLTNDKKLSAYTVVNIYKARWYIESFFKSLKQNALLSPFIGKNENSVKIHVWSAISAWILLRYFYARYKKVPYFSLFVKLFRLNMFNTIPLSKW